MKIKYFISLFAIMTFISCSQKEKSSAQEELVPSEQEVTVNDDYEKSMTTIEKQLESLKNSKEFQTLEIQALTSKRDSLTALLKQIETSLTNIENKKIEPGIQGVNEKLNELKGQKENLEEQVKLQKKEVELADKKIILLDEEKNVYDAQKQALWDKGAPPEDFVVVDSLLTTLSDRIAEQKNRLKFLNRNISDLNDQIISITEQRASLSNKIRNNYTAKQIFEEYSKEEKGKLLEEINSVDEQLKAYLDKDSELSSELSKIMLEKSDLESAHSGLLKEQEQQESQLIQQEAEENVAKKRSRVKFALIGVAVFAVIMATFYFIGKRKRNKIK
jgi:chromosome segregation ATPase